MKTINEELIYAEFSGYSIDVMKKTFEKLIKRKETDEKKRNEIRKKAFDNAVNELFELCPQVNMIPIGMYYQSGSDCYDTNDFEEIQDLTLNYLEDKSIPKAYDDMTIGIYNKMLELWKISCENSPIVYKEYDDADFCEFCHMQLYYFDRGTKKILQTAEL